MSLEAVYRRAPPWLKNVALSAYGVAIERQRYGSEFGKLLTEAEALTFASPGELMAYRETQWALRMRAAVAQVSAYGGRELSLEAISELPILTKAEVREHLARYTRAMPARDLVRAHTSGTTGAGLQFFTTQYAHQRQWAWWWRYRRWHGIKRGEWCAVFGGRTVVSPDRKDPPFWQTNYSGRAVMFSQYHFTPERARLYLEEIHRRGIRWIHGYPSFVSLLSRAGIDAGLAGNVPVRWVTLGAENVLEPQRAAIEKMFGVAPRQHYGMAEGVANISECPRGSLHVDEDYSLVEFLPVPGAANSYRIVGTSLDNAAFPLVRYDVGDVARLSAEPCPCGRAGRVICSIDGRQEDYVTLSDGSVLGRMDHLFKDAVNVVEAQIVQFTPGAAVFRIVRAPAYRTADEEALRREVRKRTASRLLVDFEYVPHIPRTASGKMRFVVRHRPQCCAPHTETEAAQHAHH